MLTAVEVRWWSRDLSRKQVNGLLYICTFSRTRWDQHKLSQVERRGSLV